MSVSSDHELQQWTAIWQSDGEPVPPAEVIYRHVRRRRRQLVVSLVAEVVVAVGACALLAAIAAARPDPVERGFAAALGIVVMAALVISWRNWRGMLNPTEQTTAACLELSLERARRFRHAVRGGWFVLAAELAVFVPWIAYKQRLRGWVLLAVLTALAVTWLIGLGRWARRDDDMLQRIRHEFETD